MKNLLLLFIMILCAIGCTPEMLNQDDEKEFVIKDSILNFESGSKDSLWLEED